MAKVNESITVDCRTPEEYYVAKSFYERDNYIIQEDDNPDVLSFKATKEHKIFEMSR